MERESRRRFYHLVYDPNILVPTYKVWMTLPGSPERAQLLEEIAQLLVKDHPEIGEIGKDIVPVLKEIQKEIGRIRDLEKMAGAARK